MPIKTPVGMTGRFADKQIKERNRRVVRKHWWRLGLMALAIGGLGFGTWLVAPRFAVPLWGVLPAMCLCVVGAAWDQLAGTYHLVCGRDAERWTSRELRKRSPRGWHVVDWIPFGDRDVDHVLVGPGGVYAVETKYTDSYTDLRLGRGQRDAEDWASQAQRNARSVRLRLGADGIEVDVSPLVVVWGADVSGTPVSPLGAPVLRGQELRAAAWRDPRARLSREEVRSVVDILTQHRKRRIEDDRVKRRRWRRVPRVTAR